MRCQARRNEHGARSLSRERGERGARFLPVGLAGNDAEQPYPAASIHVFEIEPPGRADGVVRALQEWAVPVVQVHGVEDVVAALQQPGQAPQAIGNGRRCPEITPSLPR